MSDLSEILNALTHQVGIHLNQAISIFESFFSGYDETEWLLKTSLRQRDFEAIQKQAHQLKGTAANLRVSPVSEAAGLMESAAREGDTERCKNAIATVSEQIASLKSQMALYRQVDELKILIVEDNVASGKVLEQIVENLGHLSLGIVSSPERALLAVKQELPDLIFMDIDLSAEMNGIHAAELLSGYHAIPVVFVSIHADEAIIKAAKTHGIGYVVKPFTPREIEEMIGLASKNIINRQRADRAAPVKLKAKDDNRIFFINLHDVVYFEAKAHTIYIYTDYAAYKLNTSLKDIKALDSSDGFIQPHRSFLVNRAYISELINEHYTYKLKLKSLSTFIPVSKDKVKAVKTAFDLVTSP